MASYEINDGDIAEVRIHYDFNGQRLMNVLHYRCDAANEGPDGPDVILSLAGAFTGLNSYAEAWANRSTSKCEIVMVQAQKVYPTRWIPRAAIVVVPGILSPANAPDLPQNTAVSIYRQVDESRKGGKSRIEVPGLVGTSVSSGVLSPLGVTRYQELSTHVSKKLSYGDNPEFWSPCVWRFGQSGQTAKLVTMATPQRSIRVLGRRTVGRGI